MCCNKSGLHFWRASKLNKVSILRVGRAPRELCAQVQLALPQICHILDGFAHSFFIIINIIHVCKMVSSTSKVMKIPHKNSLCLQVPPKRTTVFKVARSLTFQMPNLDYHFSIQAACASGPQNAKSDHRLLYFCFEFVSRNRLKTTL